VQSVLEAWLPELREQQAKMYQPQVVRRQALQPWEPQGAQPGQLAAQVDELQAQV
jgi:hypothetical protein